MRIPKPDAANITCPICKTSLPISAASLQQHIKLGTEALERAETLQFSDTAKARYLLVSVLPRLTPLALSTYPLLSILQLLQQLFISAFSVLPPAEPERDRLLQDTAICAGLVLAGMEDVYPPGHPSKGVQYVTMAKLLMAEFSDSATAATLGSSLPAGLDVPLPTGIARLRMALELLGKGAKELHLGFGKDGGLVGKDVALLALGLEREIGMWSAMGPNRRIR